jgi:hypothetical protein
MHSVDIPFPQQKDETEQIQNMGRGMHHGKRLHTGWQKEDQMMDLSRRELNPGLKRDKLAY